MRVRGLGSAFTRVGCSPSSLYTFCPQHCGQLRSASPRPLVRAGGSPNLRSSTSGVAAGALKFSK
jgi:hypothetical protein